MAKSSSKHNLVASSHRPRTRPPAKTELGHHCLAVLIGNGRVRNANGKGYALDIPGIDKDVNTLAAVLGDAESAGFEVRKLIEPTLIDARREIARAAREVGPDDTLLMYYSGTSTLGADNLLYLPVSDSDVDFLEATCLDTEYVLSCLRQTRSRRQVLLMDGCHSGAFFVSNRGIPSGFCAITSCGPDQYSYCDGEGGFFTRDVVEGLRGAAADADGDGVVTTDELFRHVLKKSRTREAAPATPQLWSWNLPAPIPLVHVRQRLFVSYRRTDSSLADCIVKRLEADGYAAWVDRADLHGGGQWRKQIEQAIENCDAMILVLSRASVDSDEVYKELARALELGKPVIPVTLGEVELHGWFKEKLDGIQHIECSDTQETWYPRLIDALRMARRATREAAR